MLNMENFIRNLLQESIIEIKEKKYKVKTKTFYTIEEDKNVSYVKCELSNNKVLVVIPEDDYMYIGEVIPNMNYEYKDSETIIYENEKYTKTGEGHQIIINIEFGSEDEVEGKCEFSDYESGDKVISLGVLTDKNERADVFAKVISLEDVKIN